MASLRARLDGLLTDVGLTPGRTLLDDVQALASALGVDGNACVAEIVGASELALYGANGAHGMLGCQGGAPISSNGGIAACLPSAPKSTSDAAHASRASLLKKRKMSERDAEVSDEMQVTTLMQFVDGVVDAAGLGSKHREPPSEEASDRVGNRLQQHLASRQSSQADGEHADQNQGGKSEEKSSCLWWRRRHTKAKLSCNFKPQDFPAFKQDLDKWALHMQSTRRMSKRLADRVVVLVLRAASWLVDQEKVQPSLLCATDLIRSPDPEGAEVAKEYLAWLEKEKGVSKAHLQQVFHAFILLAEFLWGGHDGKPEGKVLQALRKASASAKFHVTERRFNARDHIYRLNQATFLKV